MSIVSWNINKGLINKLKQWYDIDTSSSPLQTLSKYHIILLSETDIKNKRHLPHIESYFPNHKLLNNTQHQGLIILISNAISHLVEWTKNGSPFSYTWMKINQPVHPIHLCFLYAKHNNSLQFEDVNIDITQIPSDQPIILLGDLNAWTNDNIEDTNNENIFPRVTKCKHQTNQNGRDLLSLCKDQSLTIWNGRFGDQGSCTWHSVKTSKKGPDKGKTTIQESLLDYVITSNSLLSKGSFSLLPEYPDSDHTPISFKLAGLAVKKVKSARHHTFPDRSSPSFKQLFQDLSSEPIVIALEDPPSALLSKLTKHIHSADLRCNKALSKMNPEKPWFSDSLRDIWNEKLRLRSEMLNDPSLASAYKNISRNFKRAYRKAKEKYEKALFYTHSNDTRSLINTCALTKKVQKRNKHKLQPRPPDRALKDHLTNLYYAPNIPQLHMPSNLKSSPPSIKDAKLCNLVTTYEVTRAINQTKEDSASGRDGIRPVHLKLLTNHHDYIASFFNKILDTKE